MSPPLQKGDLIYLTAPAKSIDSEFVTYAVSVLEKMGFTTRVSSHCLGQYHYFSGTDEQRLIDIQEGIDDPKVKAILCVRGGYGCIRIVDRIQWASMLRNPKWLIGFSDITVFHQRLQRFDIPSLHATMPLNFKENSQEAFSTLLSALKNEPYSIAAPPSTYNKVGSVKAKLVGGNLSILYGLLGTDDQIDYTDTVLFIEDLAEQLYHLDRMFYAFSKAGILDKIKGLIVGGMTDMQDTAVPIGKTYQEVITEHFQFRNIPIAFDFPAGHISDNRALVLGSVVDFKVDDQGSMVQFFNEVKPLTS